MEYVRSFVAIEMPEAVRENLARLQERYRREALGVARWVDPGSIHITLKFLGNVASVKIPAITQALLLVAKETRPFFLELGEAGVFPNPGNPQVIWVGLKGDLERLAELQKKVEETLCGLGFAPEPRPFIPHLTLARLRDKGSLEERRRLSKAFLSGSMEPAPPFKIDSMVLMKSQLTPKGAIYTPLASLTFGGDSSR